MILVLIINPGTPNRVVRRLQRTAKEKNVELITTGVLGISLVYPDRGQVLVRHYRRGLISPQVIFHWLPPRYGRSMLDALALGGFRLVNPLRAWRTGHDKAMQLAVFEREGIPHPWTAFTHGSWDTLVRSADWEGREYVMKPHNSGRGNLVEKTDKEERAGEIFSRLHRRRGGVLLQKYLTPPGLRCHYRVEVVGGKAINVGRLKAGDEDAWVTNSARGGIWEEIEDIDELECFPARALSLAVEAAAAVGADYSGVDVMEGAEGDFYVLEANENPGFSAQAAEALSALVLNLAEEEGDKE